MRARPVRERNNASLTPAVTPRKDGSLIPGAPPERKNACLTPAGRGDRGGFTLVELVIVIIILGLVVSIVGPRLWGRVGQSKTAAAQAQIELLGAALDQYRLDVGAYPRELEALVRNPGVANWSGPYLKKPAIPKDPWGNPYLYRCCPGTHGDYDLWSHGADGAPGGEGENRDVTSWEVR
jgi:general secretion pathway protein G